MSDAVPSRAPDETPSSRIWTIANALTLSRLLLTPVLVYAIAEGRTHLACATFALAVVTDLADGRVARRSGQVSAFGGFLDHATDAIFVASGLGVLASSGIVPPLLPLLLLAAFAQYSLDSRVLAGATLRASRLGRWNGIGYFALLGTPIVRDALEWTSPSDATVRMGGFLLLASTVLSMLDRAAAFFAHRRSASESGPNEKPRPDHEA